jgi:hypothetical protein
MTADYLNDLGVVAGMLFTVSENKAYTWSGKEVRPIERPPGAWADLLMRPDFMTDDGIVVGHMVLSDGTEFPEPWVHYAGRTLWLADAIEGNEGCKVRKVVLGADYRSLLAVLIEKDGKLGLFRLRAPGRQRHGAFLASQKNPIRI